MIGIARTAKIPEGDITNPVLQSIIAKQGLQQTQQRLGSCKERKVGAKDYNAARGEVAFVQRAEIDHGIAVTQLPEDQGNQTHHQMK